MSEQAAKYGPNKPSIWEMAKGEEIPEDHWEYRIRKNKNDAVYANLAYVPYSSTIPARPRSEVPPKFMWTRKDGAHASQK